MYSNLADTSIDGRTLFRDGGWSNRTTPPSMDACYFVMAGGRILPAPEVNILPTDSTRLIDVKKPLAALRIVMGAPVCSAAPPAGCRGLSPTDSIERPLSEPVDRERRIGGESPADVGLSTRTSSGRTTGSEVSWEKSSLEMMSLQSWFRLPTFSVWAARWLGGRLGQSRVFSRAILDGQISIGTCPGQSNIRIGVCKGPTAKFHPLVMCEFHYVPNHKFHRRRDG